MNVKVNWSGGKDSTASVILYTLKGISCDIVCYIPMFTDCIPLIQKKHYDFIIRASKVFEEWGHRVHIVSGMTYYDYVTHIAKVGKYKGMIFGFPAPIRGKCGFKRDSKLKSLNSLNIDFDIEDVGIAFDEPDRYKKLSDKKVSILYESEYTEEKAFELCIRYNLLSPIYSGVHRDGCVLCPFSKKWEREQWFADYPEAKTILLELQNIVKTKRPDRPPLMNYEYFI